MVGIDANFAKIKKKTIYYILYISVIICSLMVGIFIVNVKHVDLQSLIHCGI